MILNNVLVIFLLFQIRFLFPKSDSYQALEYSISQIYQILNFIRRLGNRLKLLTFESARSR